jgi:hypothetical protein
VWKLLFLARRGWKLIPREQRRKLRKTAFRTARNHGPTVARQVRTAVKQAKQARRSA